MSFHQTAEDIVVEDGHILKAKLRNDDGESEDAELDLNELLGNENGAFQWEGQNFSETADDVDFALEGDENVPVLRASLADSDGVQLNADINLAERLGNDNGNFVLV